MTLSPKDILQRIRLRDTQPRRLVLRALLAMDRPLLHKDIEEWIGAQDAAINLVTIYRTLDIFLEKGIVHRQPSSGGYVLCTLTDTHDHHGLLSCDTCGHVEEFADKSLCKAEDTIAKKAGFTPRHHVSEIIGTCFSCSQS